MDAVRRVQSYMVSYGSAIKVDGHWGEFTANAYESLTPLVKQVVDSMLRADGLSPAMLNDRRKKQTSEYLKDKAEAKLSREVATDESQKYDKYVHSTPLAVIKEIADTVGKMYPEIGGATLLKVIQLETGQSPDGSFNPTVKGGFKGGYLGLGQFDSKGSAWASAKIEDPKLPNFKQGVFHPYWAIRAIAAYAAYNIKQLRKSTFVSETKERYDPYRGPITPEIIYSAHNQGLLGLKRLLNKNLKNVQAFKVQSDKAKVVIASAVSTMTA